MSLAPIAGVKTFVFPRNLIAHQSILLDYGIEGYRNARRMTSRLHSLASELNVFEKPDTHAARSDLIAIPAGSFINWLHGVRRLIPPTVFVLRLGVCSIGQ